MYLISPKDSLPFFILRTEAATLPHIHRFDFSKTPLKGIYYASEPTMEELLDVRSDANHGLTLREAQINYKAFGACSKEMIPYTGKATIDEFQDKE